MSIRKYEECGDCYFNDGRVPSVCEDCFDGDQFEPSESWDEDDSFGFATAIDKRKVIPITAHKLKEAA